MVFKKRYTFAFSNLFHCALSCAHSKKCTRFLDDGEKCHLLERFQFQHELGDGDASLTNANSLVTIKDMEGMFRCCAISPFIIYLKALPELLFVQLVSMVIVVCEICRVSQKFLSLSSA